MSETIQILLGIILLLLVFFLSRLIMGWRIRRACEHIMKDLENRDAVDPFSAAELPYAKVAFLRFGLRDFRPKALGYLVQHGIVGMTPDGKHYLNKGARPAA